MKSKIKLVWAVAIVVLVLLFVISILFNKSDIFGSSRSALGNSEFEILLEKCEVASGELVFRSYEGNAALTASWWTITLQPREEKEKQIYYMYRSPGVVSIHCSVRGLGIVLTNGQRHELSIDEAKTVWENQY